MAGCFCFGLAAPLIAAEPAVTSTENHGSPNEKNVSAAKPVDTCLTDLRAFDSQMEKDGYWLGGSCYVFGDPARGYSAADAIGYENARPSYEVRVLVASATILARHGQRQPCEDVLATARDTYKQHLADLHSGGTPRLDIPGWRQLQLATAQSVTDQDISFRSDELIGTEVRNPQNEALGSIDDLIISPETGKIAYLVIARGGFFGIDEKYVPVPWGDFKIAPKAKLLVLDTTKATVDVAPEVNHDRFTTRGQFDQESQKVDVYWKAHLPNKDVN